MDLSLAVTSSAANFALASLLIELTPGPNMTWLAMTAAGEGRIYGLRAVAGVGLGLAVSGTVAAFGVAELIQASTLAYEILRWAGIAFLFYFAYDGWRDGVTGAEPDRKRYFLRGLFANILNPKAYIFYISVLPAFIDPEKPVMAQTLTLTAIYVVIATLVHFFLVVGAGTLHGLLIQPERARIVARTMSVALAAVAVWFAVTTAR